MTRPPVVFDLDGCLVDSEPYWRDGFRDGLAAMATRLDRPAPVLSDAQLLHYEGGRVPDTLTSLAADFLGVTPTRHLLAGAVDATVASASTAMRHRPTPIAAAVDTAKELHRAGHLLAVASSSAKPFIEATLTAVGIRDLFTAIESAFELAHGKPHPEVYLNAARALDADPACCIAIEDSKTGVESALRAGLPTVWVKAGADPTLMAAPGRAPLHVVDQLSPAAVHEAERSMPLPHTDVA